MTASTSILESGHVCWLRRHRNLLTGVAFMVAAWIIYLPSAWYGFVNYDDVRILRDHPELYGQATLSADLHAIFKTNFPREEPLLLRDVTWALDSRIFGFGNPLGYHLGNVMLHGLVVALMFAFLLGTTRRYNFALVVSTAYLILAIHTEPVAWIMGRKDILSTFFMLLALCAQTKRLTSINQCARGLWYLTTLACFVAGLFSKINVLVFPLVLFLHAILLPHLNGDRPPSGSFQRGRILAMEILLLVPGLVISVLVYNWYRQTLVEMGIFNRGYSAHGLGHLWNLLMIDPLAFWAYLKQVFFPCHLKVFYTWPQIETTYPAWQVVVSFTTLILAGVTGIWLFLKRKDIFFYYSVFFVLMVPYVNLLYIGIWVAERYLYFPSFCLLAAVVSVGSSVLQRHQSPLRIMIVTLGIACVADNIIQKLSYQQAWRNGETLWQYHLSQPHPHPMAYASLAAYYYAEASGQKNAPQADIAMRKMAVVVDAGLAEFWPDHQQPPMTATYYLFFLQAIVQELSGHPEVAVTNLLISDRIYPKLDDTNLYLARLYQKLAASASDPQQRDTYALAGYNRFKNHLAIAYHDRPLPSEAQKELSIFEAAALHTNPPAILTK